MTYVWGDCQGANLNSIDLRFPPYTVHLRARCCGEVAPLQTLGPLQTPDIQPLVAIAKRARFPSLNRRPTCGHCWRNGFLRRGAGWDAVTECDHAQGGSAALLRLAFMPGANAEMATTRPTARNAAESSSTRPERSPPSWRRDQANRAPYTGGR